MNKEEFIKETKKIGIELNNQILKDLEAYYNILKEENTKYNLTRIISQEDVYLKHFYDSLTITKIVDINNQSICDLGSGAGFTGLVLAICFLNTVKEKLNLNHVNIINTRVEEYARKNREIFDIVTARAVAPLKHLLEYGVPLVKIEGSFIAMKANIEGEIENIDNYYAKLDIKEIKKMVFNLPKENSLRTLLKYQKLKVTNQKYPRRYSDIIKKEI